MRFPWLTTLVLIGADAAHGQDAPRGPLADSTSPVLERLSSSPIAWAPWGPEPLARALREGKPILFWSAYVGCSWCERMRLESFGDPELAALINEHCVCVAIDRDSLPVVDSVYLGALALVLGQGGWPITALLDPQTLQPFYIGTYFPPAGDAERELPGFPELIATSVRQWDREREPLIQFARRLAAGLPELLAPEVDADGVPRGLAERGAEALLGEYDARHGGFGAGTKFPHPERLELLLELGSDRGEAAVLHTLHALTRSGVHDLLEGGFHRSALDRAWDRPEYGRPLTLQTRLASLLARVGVERERPELVAAARGACDWVLERLVGERGRLLAGEDGAIGGVLGLSSTWTPEEVAAAVGPELAGLAVQALGLATTGDRGPAQAPATSARRAPRRPAPLPGGVLPDAGALDPERLALALERLRAARAQRPRAPLDPRTFAGRSGVAAAGLAEVGVLLEEPRYVQAAARALEFALEALRDADGRLHRTWRDGRLGPLAVAEDFVGLLRGALALHAATGEERWLERAIALHAEGQERFGAPDGGWFDAARADDPSLPIVPRGVRDGELPAVDGELLVAQVELARRTGDGDFLAAAARTAVALAARLGDDPAGSARGLVGLARLERLYPEAVPRGEGPVVRLRDPLVAYELRSDPAPPTEREGGVALLLTLTVAEGHHIAAAEPITEGPMGLGIALSAASDGDAALIVDPAEPDYGRLVVEGAPLATHGGEARFHLFVSPPTALAGAKLALTLEVWSDAGPTPVRTLALDLSRFRP